MTAPSGIGGNRGRLLSEGVTIRLSRRQSTYLRHAIAVALKRAPAMCDGQQRTELLAIDRMADQYGKDNHMPEDATEDVTATLNEIIRLIPGTLPDDAWDVAANVTYRLKNVTVTVHIEPV